MKGTGSVRFLAFLSLLVGGCSVAPEHLASTPLDSDEPVLISSMQSPVDEGTVAINPSSPMVYRGFAVLDFRAKRDEHGMVFIVGEVKNVGAATQGVELQAVLRDGNDRVVAAGNFCPAANHSIIPDEVRPFAYSLGRHDDGMHAELRIVRTFYTMDTLGIAALPR